MYLNHESPIDQVRTYILLLPSKQFIARVRRNTVAIVQRELNYLPALRRPARRQWVGLSRMAMPALLIMAVFVAYLLISTIIAWGQVKLDDLRYGYPRTFSTDG